MDEELRLADEEYRHAVGLGDRLVTEEGCLLYTSDAADERTGVDLGGRRIIKKKREQIPMERR